MSQLSPCTHCQRHVRRSESACPFCGQSLQLAPARVIAPNAGVKRAALFALGASLAAASCGGDDDSSGDVKQQQMGSDPAAMGGDGSGSDMSSGGADDGANTGGTDVAPAGGSINGGDVPLPQPMYGAPIAPPTGGTAGAPDDGDPGMDGDMPMEMDAGVVEPDPFPEVQPLYGAVPAPDSGDAEFEE